MVSALDPSEVPAWPVVAIDLRTDGRVRVDDETVTVPDGADTRQTAIEAVAAIASLIGRPVRAEASEPDGTVWPLVVTPEGHVLSAGTARRPPPTAKRRGFGGVLRRSSPEPLASPPPSAVSPPPPPPGPPGPTPIPPPPPAPGTLVERGSPPGPRRSVPTPAAPLIAPVPPTRPDLPEPDTESRAALDRILFELRLGRFAAARSRAQLLVDRLAETRGRRDEATLTAGEVLAYTTFVAGDAARAALLYADLALPFVDGSGPVGVHGTRLADNAQFCWHRTGNSPTAQGAGARVLALRTKGWGTDSAQSRAARSRLG
ncbi:hypothetical protein OG216_38230 [Streptomycetaceae bacterium NBC_01309]